MKFKVYFTETNTETIEADRLIIADGNILFIKDSKIVGIVGSHTPVLSMSK